MRFRRGRPAGYGLLAACIARLQGCHSSCPVIEGLRVDLLVRTLRQAVAKQFAIGCGQRIKALRRRCKNRDAFHTGRYSLCRSENRSNSVCVFALSHRQSCETRDQYGYGCHSDCSVDEPPIVGLHGYRLLVMEPGWAKQKSADERTPTGASA